MNQEKNASKKLVFLRILLSYYGAFLILIFIYSGFFIPAKLIIGNNILLSHYIASLFTIALLQFLAISAIKKKYYAILLYIYNKSKESRFVRFVYNVGGDDAIRNLVALCSLPITTSLYSAYLVMLIIGRLRELNVIELKDPLLSIIKANEFSILVLIALDRVRKAFEGEKKDTLVYLQMLRKYIEEKKLN